MAVKGALFLFIQNYSLCLSLVITALTAALMGIFYKRSIRNAVKRHTAQLPNTPQQLNALINSLNDIIFEFDENKICLNTWFNDFTERLIDPRQLVGKKLEDILGKERALKFNNALDYVITNRKPTSIQYLSEHGTGKWLNAKLTPVFDREGNYTHRISASISDISEQKKYAEALKEKERLLLEAQTVAKIGNWLFDRTNRETYLSANLLGILGTAQIPDNIEKHEYYLSLVHPDDRDSCHQFLLSIATSVQQDFEHRIITSAGKLRYVRITIGNRVFNDDGSLKRIFGIIQDITENKLSERAIKKGRAELIEAQTIAKIGNWSLDTATLKLAYSQQIHHIFEADPGILVKWGIIRLLLTYVHQNDKFILQHLFKSATTVANYNCIFRIVTPTGRIKYVSVIIGKILKNNIGIRKIIGTLQDVTDRKQVEIDYKRTENKYRLVLETIKMAAISLDNKGMIAFCNPYLANLLGYTPKDILGMQWIENFIPDELKESFTAMLTDNAMPQQYINPVVCKNGEQRIISWQITMTYDENGLLKETTGIGEDITDQQKATLELISAKELAEKASRFKSDFLSIMSHEIRTPMNAVIGTTNLLISDDPRPEQMEYLNILKFSGENLLSIINDILDYNKIEAGKLELNELKFNIHTLIKKIGQTFAAKALEKGLTLELNIDSTIPEFLTGDQMRLSQILNNLISNAVKFTLKGKITIDLYAVQLDINQVTIKFTVADTGVGISPDNINIIFDPFVQETVVNHNNVGGTGLGLAITKRLVNLHQSDISVISKPGEGTLFTFAIVFNLPETEMNSNKLNADNAPMLNLYGMSVLIVDDNKMNLLIASRFLKKWQATVDEALNGQLAVDMVNKKAYDLIIMDLQMPVMDGFEATEVIKKIHPQVPVIALTADAMPETYTKALAAGMSDYLTKPFVPGIFFEKVSRYYRSEVRD